MPGSWEYKFEHGLNQDVAIPSAIPGAYGMARLRAEADKGPTADE